MTTALLNTDDQTLEDLGIFSKQQKEGIFFLYNRTYSRGGEAVLKEWFRSPLADKAAIETRLHIIEQFALKKTEFPISGNVLDSVEKYLAHVNEDAINRPQPNTLAEKDISNGVNAVVQLIQGMKKFVDSEDTRSIDAYEDERLGLHNLLSYPVFKPPLKEKSNGKLSYSVVTAYDQLFRNREYDRLHQLLSYIYSLDVYLSVAQLSLEKGFIIPRVLDKRSGILNISGVYHPSIKNAVGNEIKMNSHKNLIFLTGANMAGKSTLLRSVSTAVYLAHVGFPVAAKKMEFSVMDGIYTTINLPDNLGIGASHFYVEVLRSKKMALELSKGKSLFIIFDELFRGTNVKDAHEATVAISKAFAKKSNSLFIISSHIVEAGEQLKSESTIGFQYMPTRLNGHEPEYSYRLEDGITDDRHGMVIIKNEGILEILKEGRKTSMTVQQSKNFSPTV